MDQSTPDTSTSTGDVLKFIGFTGLVYVGMVVVGILLFIGLFMLLTCGRGESFYLRPGFRIGSYDPAMYPSDWLVRRP